MITATDFVLLIACFLRGTQKSAWFLVSASLAELECTADAGMGLCTSKLHDFRNYSTHSNLTFSRMANHFRSASRSASAVDDEFHAKMRGVPQNCSNASSISHCKMPIRELRQLGWEQKASVSLKVRAGASAWETTRG